MDSPTTIVQKLAIWAVPVLLAVTLHEVAHGWTARALGDDTAARLGRLSLNPLKHIDPVGTILVPAVLLFLGGILFGWAKPVPVMMSRMHNPRRDMAIVAVAGPVSNFVMAVLWGLLFKFAAMHGGAGGLWTGLRLMAQAGIAINLVLMVLNLIPIPPLDGGRVLTGLLPEPMARKLDRLEPYGLVILLLLMFTGVLGTIMAWPMSLSYAAVSRLLSIA